jgi:hypothetical protein
MYSNPSIITVIIDVDSSHRIDPYEEYTNWIIPVHGIDSFDVKTTAEKSVE